ncbi:glycosyl hydrolases family 16 domain-containing protein [Hirsutella rhossiliensis]
MPRLAAALCECGYSAEGSEDDNGPWLFTDMLESDFTNVPNVSGLQSWVPQQFNVSAKAGRGRYGKAFSPGNIASHPKAKLGEEKPAAADAVGVELRVGSAVANGAIPVAEIDSAALDMHYGSYRAGMKLTAVHGTCAAFFWYFNDTQEIDMEFLSQDYNHERRLYPVNLVIQSQKSMKAGYDASRTDSFQRVNLTFDPTDGFHEYRARDALKRWPPYPPALEQRGSEVVRRTADTRRPAHGQLRQGIL